MTTHWAVGLIGRPWVLGGQGPDAFDCWGFVRYVQREHYGIDIAPMGYSVDSIRQAAAEVAENPERENWLAVPEPAEGDIVLMARNRLPVHVGVWVAANGTVGVLHCVERSGVLYNPARSLALVGWGGLQYFRHKSKCSTL